MTKADEEQYQMLLEDKGALKQIRSKFNIEEARFIQGLAYVGFTLDATMSKTKAYATAFKTDPETAGKVSAQFHRSKWIQELIMYLRPQDDTLYMSEVKRIIGVNMAIINDRASTAREQIDATKALQPYLKFQKKMDADELASVANSVGMSMVTKLTQGIGLLSRAGKMIDERGEIIDVKLIE